MIESSARPKVCILLAIHNGAPWLEAQLDTLLAQEDVELTILASDDGSRDNSLAICKRYAQEQPSLRLLPEHPPYGNAAGNFFHLLEQCPCGEYDYIAFCDQDDLWHPRKLISAAEALEQHGADGYSGNVTAAWPDGRHILIDKAQPQTQADFLFEGPGPGCTFVLTKGLAQALNTFIAQHQTDIQQLELHDWFIYAFARSRRYRWYIDPHVYLTYRQHDHNTIGANIGPRQFWHRARQILSGKAIQQVITTHRILYGTADSPTPPVTIEPTRHSLLQLIPYSTQCRRKKTHQLAMALSLLLLCLKPAPLPEPYINRLPAPRPAPKS